MAFTKETFHYGPHNLQYVEVTVLQPDRVDCKTSKDEEPLYWVIYIHGGAWRDPLVSADSFEKTQSILLSNGTYADTIHKKVAAFASLNYRLSPHPSHPQLPPPSPSIADSKGNESGTPETRYRNAKYPDHITDVLSGIHLLQQKYNFAENYLLVGHSAGATMAFQAVMADLLPPAVRGTATSTEDARTGQIQIVPPKAIMGVSGIYDLRRLREDYAGVPIYEMFLVGAFGEDHVLGSCSEDVSEGLAGKRERTYWDFLSPAYGPGSVTGAITGDSNDKATVKDGESVARGWSNGRLAVIVSSVNDGMINDVQNEIMITSLENAWKKDGEKREVLRLADLQDEHDDIWINGKELARAIIFGLERLSGLS